MSFTLSVENLRALRKVEWSPQGVCALVGPNGAGKSTLLQTLKFLHISVQRGVEEGFRQTFGGSYGLRNRLASDDEAIRVGVAIDHLHWSIRLSTRGPSIVWPVAEQLDDPTSLGGSWSREEGDSNVYTCFAQGDPPLLSHTLGSTTNLAVEFLPRFESMHGWPNEKRLVSLLQNLRIFHDPNLWSLRTQGSPTSADSVLDSRGANTFAILRMWNERREHRHRHQFVLEGLQAAFPGACADLDFESAGQTTFARVWAPGSELPTPIANEANGVLAMLIYLCDIASGEPDGLVAIDEPENSLHPHALRELVDSANAWSEAYATTIVFATHSPVILDALTGKPEQVWVMRNDAGDTPNPTRLDRLKNPDWLRHFALGTLYASGEFGSNDDAA